MPRAATVWQSMLRQALRCTDVIPLILTMQDPGATRESMSLYPLNTLPTQPIERGGCSARSVHFTAGWHEHLPIVLVVVRLFHVVAVGVRVGAGNSTSCLPGKGLCHRFLCARRLWS